MNIQVKMTTRRMYSMILIIFIITSNFNRTFADENPIFGTQVDVKTNTGDFVQVTNISTNVIGLYYFSSTTQISSIFTKAFPLIDSNCFCSYDRVINLLLCSPLLQDSSSYPLSTTYSSLINITLNDCTFSNNRLTLPNLPGKNIDDLRLYNTNQQDYLVFDITSFASYQINRLYIIYSSTEPITMLLISNETFSSSWIKSSLRMLYIDSCYLIPLNKPWSELLALESLKLINIEQFSWFDWQQQLISLPKLRSIYIGEDLLSNTNEIFNVLSCQDFRPQWKFTYHLIQTCSCKLISFLQTIHRVGDAYQCLNSENSFEIIADICQLKGKEYLVPNETNLACNQCSVILCPNGRLCAETFDTKGTCLLLSPHDYETIRNRIPFTIYTKPFLYRESQGFLNLNINQTLEPSGFHSLATILIDSNKDPMKKSTSDAQAFHQTLAEMLSLPWSPQIYSASFASESIWKELILSLDESVKNINDSEQIFEFQSKPISTISLRLSPDEQPPEKFTWKITDENQITTTDIANETVTTGVFLQLNSNQFQASACVTSDVNNNCTNRFSITSIKSQKLFYYTNHIPQYDVISILAPSSNQRVTFSFNEKLSTTDGFVLSDNQTNFTSNSFYDELNPMISLGNCMYLNTTSMIWQTDGCLTDRRLSNSTAVTCICEHLTMFTVFFSLSCTNSPKALDILSWIGCVLSILGLSITLIIFLVINHCRQTKKSHGRISLSYSSSSQELRRRIVDKPRRLSMVKSMLFVLCLLLILMNILILVLTFIKSGRNLTCTILSSALYYFTLTAFLWKFFFAIHQSLFITNIFHPYWSNRTLFLIYLFITFSFPIAPLIFMFVKYQNFTFISSTCNYCWLTREFLLYGLITPILIITALNLMFYLYTMIHLCLRNRQQAGLRSTKSDRSRLIQNIKIGLFFAIIMGLSWILGFLLLIPNSYVQLIGNILFCLFNTLQGFAFSMMVFCMLERKQCQKCCCFWKYKTQMEINSNSQSHIPQPVVILSNGNNYTKPKTSFNSSIYTSTTSGGENNSPEGFDHYPNKMLAARRDDDIEEHVYSTLVF